MFATEKKKKTKKPRNQNKPFFVLLTSNNPEEVDGGGFGLGQLSFLYVSFDLVGFLAVLLEETPRRMRFVRERQVHSTPVCTTTRPRRSALWTAARRCARRVVKGMRPPPTGDVIVDRHHRPRRPETSGRVSVSPERGRRGD